MSFLTYLSSSCYGFLGGSEWDIVWCLAVGGGQPATKWEEKISRISLLHTQLQHNPMLRCAHTHASPPCCLPQDAVNRQGMHHSQLHLHHAWASAGTLLGDFFYRVQRHPSTDLICTSMTCWLQGAPRHEWILAVPLACSSMCVPVSRETLGKPRMATRWSPGAVLLGPASGKAWAGEPPTHGLTPDYTVSAADRALAFVAMDPCFEEQGWECFSRGFPA